MRLNEISAGKPASGVRGYHIAVRISLRGQTPHFAGVRKIAQPE